MLTQVLWYLEDYYFYCYIFVFFTKIIWISVLYCTVIIQKKGLGRNQTHKHFIMIQ